MKLLITGLVKSVGPIEPTKKANGFTQRFVIEQPERKDEFNRVLQQQQIFQIEVYDRDKSNKFLDQAAVGTIRECKVWLKGEVSNKDDKPFYFLKLKLL